LRSLFLVTWCSPCSVNVVLCFVVSEYFECLLGVFPLLPQQQTPTSLADESNCLSYIFYSGLNESLHFCSDECRSRIGPSLKFCKRICPGHILYLYFLFELENTRTQLAECRLLNVHLTSPVMLLCIHEKICTPIFQCSDNISWVTGRTTCL